eukprot:CAMPEP_0177639472 /NCGR_PEP_ID=MMETSP0447-20121125/6037_1 /TAXON_ID=0 /ORGANISM="Stygamoeba regulata, Strain BSH-02190019" /LENGTH=159 /DNA_ID=CAMNT_0019141497 /DNA_START=423 /DNA_END=902 /DNA_ORIENTATION=-
MHARSRGEGQAHVGALSGHQAPGAPAALRPHRHEVLRVVVKHEGCVGGGGEGGAKVLQHHRGAPPQDLLRHKAVRLRGADVHALACFLKGSVDVHGCDCEVLFKQQVQEACVEGQVRPGAVVDEAAARLDQAVGCLACQILCLLVAAVCKPGYVDAIEF